MKSLHLSGSGNALSAACLVSCSGRTVHATQSLTRAGIRSDASVPENAENPTSLYETAQAWLFPTAALWSPEDSAARRSQPSPHRSVDRKGIHSAVSEIDKASMIGKVAMT